MTHPSVEESKGFAKNIENISKVGTLILATLYVLGLLITNMHLMALGIADFSALQARFVMIGALFVLYTAVLLAFIATATVLPVLLYRIIHSSQTPLKLRTKTAKAVLLLISPIAAWGALEIFGSLVGYMYPWGRPWDAALNSAFKWRFYVTDAVTCARQLADAFGHLKIIIAVLAPLTGVAFVMWALRTEPSESTPSDKSHASSRRLSPLLLLFAFPGLALLIFGYAESVFPNVRYNIGGGQPRIIELHLKAADSLLLRKELPVLRDSSPTSNTTIPLALWFQDGSFFYVTPATTPSTGESTLTALAQESIQAVRYLRGYVRVGSGGRIDSTQLIPGVR